MNCSSRKRKKRKMRIKMPLFLLECWNFTSHCTSNSGLECKVSGDDTNGESVKLFLIYNLISNLLD